jgi:hypothetical protein
MSWDLQGWKFNVWFKGHVFDDVVEIACWHHRGIIISRIMDGRGDEFQVVVWLRDDACSQVPWQVKLVKRHSVLHKLIQRVRPLRDHAVSLLYHDAIMLQKRKGTTDIMTIQ